MWRPSVRRSTPAPLDPTTRVPVVDATAPEPTDGFIESADGFEAMAPVSMLERDDARRGDRRAIDPLLIRIGAVAVVTTLLVPLMIGLTSGSDDGDTVASGSTPPVPTLVTPATEPAPVATDPSTLDPESLPPAVPVNPAPASSAAAETTTAVAESSSTSTTSEAAEIEVASDDATAPAVAETAASNAAEPTDDATVEAPATAGDDADRIQNCAIDYDVVAGDFWLRLAEGAGVPLAELLEVNGATTDTPLYPGATICLPAGSSTPPPPAPSTTDAPTTTQAPTTTAAPTTTVAPTTTPATTPATTAAPTTPNTPATSPAGPEDVKQIIRDVWPDELEERALEIAFRESRYVPTAKNFCCYGLFQIYWNVHKSWLADIGITDDQQLFDPATNARAAYALYQRAGGWAPWAQTAY